jgi:hypothetical protein
LSASKASIVGTAIIATTTPTYMSGNPVSFMVVCVWVGIGVTIGFEVGVEVVEV